MAYAIAAPTIPADASPLEVAQAYAALETMSSVEWEMQPPQHRAQDPILAHLVTTWNTVRRAWGAFWRVGENEAALGGGAYRDNPHYQVLKQLGDQIDAELKRHRVRVLTSDGGTSSEKWCSCGADSRHGSFYWVILNDRHTHGWGCTKCGGTTQVG
jgi:hypothetical protein